MKNIDVYLNADVQKPNKRHTNKLGATLRNTVNNHSLWVKVQVQITESRHIYTCRMLRTQTQKLRNTLTTDRKQPQMKYSLKADSGTLKASDVAEGTQWCGLSAEHLYFISLFFFCSDFSFLFFQALLNWVKKKNVAFVQKSCTVSLRKFCTTTKEDVLCNKTHLYSDQR